MSPEGVNSVAESIECVDSSKSTEHAMTTNTDSDEYSGDKPPSTTPTGIDRQKMKELVRVKPWASTLHITLEWSAIIAVAWLVWTYWHPALYLLAVAFIGARQHALLIMMHDGSHYRLYPNREVNDWVSQIFLAWPFFFVDTLVYRDRHFAHHRYTNRDGDPDWERKYSSEWAFPKTPLGMIRVLLPYLLGIGFFINAASLLHKSDTDRKPPAAVQKRMRRFNYGRLLLMALLLGSFFLFGTTWLYAFLLFWLVPFFTWAQLCLQIRSISEHFAINSSHKGVYALTRTVRPTLLGRLFIASKNVSYHFEHHLYPAVPFYNLHKLHRLLMENPEYRNSIHITDSYWDVLFRDCTGLNGEIPKMQKVL